MTASRSARTRFASAVALLVAFVLLAVSCGGGNTREVVIPNRASQTDLLDAYQLLHNMGLRVATDRPTAYTSLRAAWVSHLVPHAGSRVPVGSTVTITPDDHGHIGSPSVLKSQPHYPVPNFIGQTATGAIRWAEARGMFWSIPRLPALPPSDKPHLLDNYRISTQQPPPGALIKQGVMVGRGFRPTPHRLTLVLR
jgi:beta-lactam-binding protein with PASTA domain